MFFEEPFISIVFAVKIRRVSRLFIVHVAQIATRNDSVFGSDIWRKAFSVYGFENLLLTSSHNLSFNLYGSFVFPQLRNIQRYEAF